MRLSFFFSSFSPFSLLPSLPSVLSPHEAWGEGSVPRVAGLDFSPEDRGKKEVCQSDAMGLIPGAEAPLPAHPILASFSSSVLHPFRPSLGVFPRTHGFPEDGCAGWNFRCLIQDLPSDHDGSLQTTLRALDQVLVSSFSGQSLLSFPLPSPNKSNSGDDDDNHSFVILFFS